MDTEKKTPENAGDQDENASAVPNFAGFFVPPGGERLVCRQAWDGLAHDRHVGGPLEAPVHCPGLEHDDRDPEAGYVASFTEWETENATWLAKLGPLVHHARVLARKLDHDPAAPVALSSAYLQAFTRLEKLRPVAAGGNPSGDGLTPPGQQPSLFEPMEDE